jgi:hypothetical protein
MKTTQYFEEQVLRKRPYIDPAWIPPILANPLFRCEQADGRWRFWGAVLDLRDGKTRALRIVTLEDSETVHNAFSDRDFGIASP